jgi:hypothetical protein
MADEVPAHEFAELRERLVAALTLGRRQVRGAVETDVAAATIDEGEQGVPLGVGERRVGRVVHQRVVLPDVEQRVAVGRRLGRDAGLAEEAFEHRAHLFEAVERKSVPAERQHADIAVCHGRASGRHDITIPVAWGALPGPKRNYAGGVTASA